MSGSAMLDRRSVDRHIEEAIVVPFVLASARRHDLSSTPADESAEAPDSHVGIPTASRFWFCKRLSDPFRSVRIFDLPNKLGYLLRFLIGRDRHGRPRSTTDRPP